MTSAENRPPFKVRGAAAIKHLNVRKEGTDDDKVLAVDVKLEIKGVDRRLCAYFDEALEPFLWRGDTDALIARNAWLGPVQYGHLITGASAEIDGQTFVGCEVKKFSIVPQDGGVITLGLAVTVYPSSAEVSRLAKLVQEDAQVAIEGPPDLFAGDPVPPSVPVDGERVLHTFRANPEQTKLEAVRAVADAAQQLPESLVEMALALVTAPGGKASISYLQRSLRIGYNQAARVLEMLEEHGIVSAPSASGHRKVLGVAA